MPHLTALTWNYADLLRSAANGTFTSCYVYNAGGDRTRKVVVKGNIREERLYLGNYELYRKYVNNTLDTERQTLHIADDQHRFALIDRLTVNNGATLTTPTVAVRYQYDNHLGSASLELDQNAAIISYEEYHPFGTTSYRSGRTETEVALKRHKYVGKERDEETGLYYYGARYYAAWIARFVSVDPLADQRSWVSPYSYCQNNPITRIDPTGELDQGPDEWLYNTVTGEMTWQSDKGGNEVQIVNFAAPNENGGMIAEGTAVIEGSEVYAGPIRGGWGASSADYWFGIPKYYNTNSIDYLKGGNYEYSMLDLKKRYQIFNNPSSSHFAIIIAEWETSGNAQPIHAIEFRRQYIAKWGTDKSFIHAIDADYWGPADYRTMLDDGLKYLKSFKQTSKAFKYTPLYEAISTGKISGNTWNQFLQETKGTYSGKDWLRKASDDYKLWKKSKGL